MSVLPRWPFAPLISFLAERRTGLEIDALDSAATLAALDGLPKLLIHGDQDELLPLEHHLALAAAAAEPKETWVVSGMGHESAAAFAPAAYIDVVVPFLVEHLAPQ